MCLLDQQKLGYRPNFIVLDAGHDELHLLAAAEGLGFHTIGIRIGVDGFGVASAEETIILSCYAPSCLRRALFGRPANCLAVSRTSPWRSAIEILPGQIGLTQVWDGIGCSALRRLHQLGTATGSQVYVQAEVMNSLCCLPAAAKADALNRADRLSRRRMRVHDHRIGVHDGTV